MNINNSFRVPVVLAMVALSSSVFAQVDGVKTTTAEVKVTKALTVSHTLEVVGSGNFPTVVSSGAIFANGTVGSTDDVPQYYAVAWDPTIGSAPTSGIAARDIPGTFNSTHKLHLKIGGTHSFQDQPQNNQGYWWDFLNQNLAASADYTVIANGDQTVPVDNYTVSIAAAIYTS